MKRTLLLLVALFGFGMAASPAEATWFHYRRAYYAPAPVYYGPAPVYYSRPYYAPVSYYAPPAVTYYAPPTVVYRPVTTFYYTPAPRVAFYYGW